MHPELLAGELAWNVRTGRDEEVRSTASSWRAALAGADRPRLAPEQTRPATEGTVGEYLRVASVSCRPTITRLSRDLARLWFVPDKTRTPTSDVIAAMLLNDKGEYAKALPVLSRPSSHQGPLGFYAMYDMAMALLNLGRAEEARRMFQTIGRAEAYWLPQRGSGVRRSEER